MLPPGCCSRFVWPPRSTSLLARAPIVVCSRGSQQKYCVARLALSEKVGATAVCVRPTLIDFALSLRPPTLVGPAKVFVLIVNFVKIS